MEMVKYTFFHVIDRHFSLLDGYCESQLIQRSKFKAQTVSNHLMDLLSAARWYVFNRTDFDSHLQCDRAGFTGFHEHLKNINKHFKREAKRETPPKTFADAVEEGKLPRGGLPSLQNAVVKVLPLVNRLLTQEKNVTSKDYTFVLSALFASIYSFSSQGRIGGFSSVAYRQFQEMIDHEHSTSHRFKTSLSYGLQAITVRSVSKKLLSDYVFLLRPQVSSDRSESKENKLFLAFDGQPLCSRSVGRLVSLFFYKILGLRLTSTGIRSLVETSAHTAFHSGFL
jgi:hypothetical protein